MRDAELLRLLRRSPNRGLDELMTAYMGLVITIVKGKLESVVPAEDIEECVSDTFAECYRNLDRIDLRKGTIKAYLCAIAKNQAVSRYHKGIKVVTPLSLDEEALTQTVADATSMEDIFFALEERRELLCAIGSLDEPDHEIIVRKYFFREPTKKIAERLAMTVTAVDTRAHRALAALRQKLGGIRS